MQPRTTSFGSRGPAQAAAQPGPGLPSPARPCRRPEVGVRGPAPGSAWAPPGPSLWGRRKLSLLLLRWGQRRPPPPAEPPRALPRGPRRAGPGRAGEERPAARGLGPRSDPGRAGTRRAQRRRHGRARTHAGAWPEPQGHADPRTRAPQSPAHTPCSLGRTPRAPAGDRPVPPGGHLPPRRAPRPGPPPGHAPRRGGKLRPYSQAAPGRAPPPAIVAPRRPRRRRLPPRRRAAEAAQAAQAEAAAAPGLRCVAAPPLPSMNGAPSAARLRTGLALAARGAPRRAHALPEAGGRGLRGRGGRRGRGCQQPPEGALLRAPRRPGPTARLQRAIHLSALMALRGGRGGASPGNPKLRGCPEPVPPGMGPPSLCPA